MGDHEQYLRYREDRRVLAAIGEVMDHRVARISVRLPRSLAGSAAAAWNRDEPGEINDESREEFELRDDAAELALIGLAISERGTVDGDEVVVDLDVVQVAAALRAANRENGG